MSSLDSIKLNTPLPEIPGIGDRSVGAWRRLGLETAGDLLGHIPLRYEQELAEQTIARAHEAVASGETGHLALRGTIEVVRHHRGRRPRTEATLQDESGTARLVWFNAGWLAGRLHPGMEVLMNGRGSLYKGHLQMTNPRFTLLGEAEPVEVSEEDGLRPIYPGSEELNSNRIRRVIAPLLEPLCQQVEDPLPEAYRGERGLPTLAEAYRAIHAPGCEEDWVEGRRRLAFEELLLMQLAVMMRRHQLRDRLKAPALRWDDAVDGRIRDRFPFPLTAAQLGVIREIAADLSNPTPMNRLLQGDVGAGKTAVAVYGMLTAVASGHQAALMAPTELLAEQHLASIRGLLEGSDVRIELLTGARPEAERRAIMERLAAGEIDILVGTHALLTHSVNFRSLALAVIDEQHRFGVTQRAQLRGKGDDPGSVPHVLVMTATPIPRTLSLTLFGDLDVSVIDERLPGRTPPVTRVVQPPKRADVYGYVADRLRAGEQAYVVVPAIEESDLGLADVQSHLRFLEEGPLAGCRLEAMHGRLDAATRDGVMERFRAGETQCLVATVVIEVGVDVPNATLMVIEHAERFGLAQLHQLRGRIGRGTGRSVCALIGEPRTPEAERRLEAIGSTTDGFAISELDLEIRGPGELFGARQSGMPPLRVADLMRDAELLAIARTDARAWIDRSPELADPDERAMRSLVLRRYGAALGLADVG